MWLAAGWHHQRPMTPKLQLGEHIKTISGREYIYSSAIRKSGGKSKQRYERPIERTQQQVMEYLSAKDKGIIERAFTRGVAISTIQDHVWTATGDRVASSTIYAYMKRHGVGRAKRDTRIDKGKETISGVRHINIIAAWNQGDSWKTIQGMIRRESGMKVGRSTIYAYMRTHGNDAKRKVALKRKRG